MINAKELDPWRRTVAAILLLCGLLAAPPAARAELAPRKVGFIGCLAKPDAADVGIQISESLEQRLARARAPGVEFLKNIVGPARAKLKGGPVNPQRLAEAGRALGADKVIVCLMTYQRQRAETIKAEAKTYIVSRNETEYVEEVYYTEVDNPDYEPPLSAAIPLGSIGPVQVSAILSGPKSPKTIKEKHVRRVPKTKRVTQEVTEDAEPDTEKPGFVRLQAGYMILDAASGKTEKRDTVSYVYDIEPMFDAMENDKDLKRKAAESTVDSLEKSILAMLATAK
jgi:hypothetical protein